MKKQVRAVDQTAYPHVLWPLRWTIAHNTWMVPLLFENVTLRNRGEHTHTQLCNVCKHNNKNNWAQHHCRTLHHIQKNIYTPFNACVSDMTCVVDVWIYRSIFSAAKHIVRFASRLIGYGTGEVHAELLPRATILGVGLEGAFASDHGDWWVFAFGNPGRWWCFFFRPTK